MYVRVGGEESEWLQVKDGLWQGCEMSPWLFNIFMDEMREVNAGFLEKGKSMQSVKKRLRVLLRTSFP